MAIGLGQQLKQIQTGKIDAIPAPIWSCSDSGSLIESPKSTKGTIHINQNQYSQELQPVPKEAEEGKDDQKKTTLRGVVGKLLYLNLTRPDLSFKKNLLSRIPAGADLNEKLKEAR